MSRRLLLMAVTLSIVTGLIASSAIAGGQVVGLEYVGDLFGCYGDVEFCAKLTLNGTPVPNYPIMFGAENVATAFKFRLPDYTDRSGIACAPAPVAAVADVYYVQANALSTQFVSPPVAVTIWKCGAQGVGAGGALYLPGPRKATFGLRDEVPPAGAPDDGSEGLLYIDLEKDVAAWCNRFDSPDPSGSPATFTGWCWFIKPGNNNWISRRFEAVVVNDPVKPTFSLKVFKYYKTVEYQVSGFIKDGGVVFNP